MRLLWLADVLRAAGLTVHEVSGWRTRGSDNWGPVRGITCHATAGSRTSTDAGEIGTLLHDSATAPAPIAQLYLSRTGHWHVVASGLCYHNLVGWSGPNKGYGNTGLLGVEAQHSNTTAEPWPDVQYRSYVRGVAALARRLGVPVARIAGHKEHQPGGYGHSSVKTDPTFNMDQFRRDVAAALAGEGNIMAALTDAEQRELLAAARAINGNLGKRVHATNERVERLGRLVPAGPADWSTDPNTQAAPDLLPLVDLLTGLRDRPEAVVDHSALAEAIVARLPATVLTADDVRAALADVLRTGVGPAA
jgi:hypothetical protein